MGAQRGREMNHFFENHFFRHKKVLVIVPHMDDEINVAGSMIHSLAGMECDITVLYTTDGNDFGKGRQRAEEAKKALSVLAGGGVEVKRLNFKSQARAGKEHYLFSKREEAVGELTGYLRKCCPEIIFCCDMDAHPDHLCTSLFFEEALGKLLKEKRDYSPLVYKGFAYETAYFATDDFWGQGEGFVLHTKKKWHFGRDTNNPLYQWDERIRFPVREECIASGENFRQNVIRNALSMHETQNAVSHAGRIINSDAVFFERRTDSLLYQAKITVSSGNGGYINDFMAVNLDDVMKRKLSYRDYLWIPEKGDGEKCIRAEFPKPVFINKIVCYQNIEKRHRIKRAQISFGGGHTEEWNMEEGSAVRMVKCFPDIKTDSLEFKILKSDGRRAGVGELEVCFDKGKPVCDFIKIMDRENFIYRKNYHKKIEYQVYGYCRRFGSSVLGKQDVAECTYRGKDGNEVLRVGLRGHEDEIYDEVVLHEVSGYQMCKGFFRRGACLFLSLVRDLRNAACVTLSKCRMFWRIVKQRAGKGTGDERS